jgi:hypothetical protein
VTTTVGTLCPMAGTVNVIRTESETSAEFSIPAGVIRCIPWAMPFPSNLIS